jgi:hypothetical protein
LHSPSIARLELLQRGRVRRAKLYYLRDLRGKKARIKERRIDDAKLAAMEAASAADREAAAIDDLAQDTDDADIAGAEVPEEAELDAGSAEAADTPAAPADQEATPDGDAEERAEA